MYSDLLSYLILKYYLLLIDLLGLPVYILTGSTGKVVASHAEIPSSSPGLTERDLYTLCASGAHGVLPCKGWGVTVSQLDLPSLTPLSGAGCGRLQLEASHWATWVTLLQVVDN